MITSSKLRRLRRARKLRRQRSVALIIVMVFVVMAAHVAFSKTSSEEVGRSVVSVVVKEGDTLWSIAKEYKPQGYDIRKYVYEVSANNGIKDGNIICGQTIFVPVTNF